MSDSNRIARRALAGVAWSQAALAALIFVPAWSIAYWQGWLYWVCAGMGILWLTLYVLRYDPALAKRRAHAGPIAEHRPQQKFIQSITSICGIATLVVSPLDHRFGWSSVSAAVSLAAAVTLAVGFAIVLVTFRENTFASSIVEIAPDQRVVKTGPYAWVRHPMYSGALLIFLATPPALGSWWGLIPAALLASALVWRLFDEETLLRNGLDGYAEYTGNVRFRLIPWIW
jgi:protein-S-isoprenylcysteine O-methyltransferase Ste14